MGPGGAPAHARHHLATTTGATKPAPTLPYFDRSRSAVGGAVALAAVAFGASWYRHATFRSRVFDLSVFDQALWKMAHGHAPFVTTLQQNVFADHLSPAVVLFVPLYRLAATPLWLFAAQALALGAGYLVLPAALAAVGVPPASRWPFRVAYVLSPLLWNAVLYDFHFPTLALPFLLIGLAAALRDDVKVLLVMVIALALLRDDLAAAGAALAVCGLRRLPRRRWWPRLAIVAAGAAWVVGGSLAGSGVASSERWENHYATVAPSFSSALAHPLHTVARIAHLVVTDLNGLALGGALVSLGLLPLLGPAYLVIALVLGLPLFVGRDVTLHTLIYHYWSPLFPFLAAAAAVGVTRLPDRYRGHLGPWLVATSAVSFFVFGPPSTATLTRHTVRRDDVARARKLVHRHDAVVAADDLGAHFAHRDVLLEYPSPFDPVRQFHRKALADKVDVVIATAPRTAFDRGTFERVTASPWFADFGPPRRYGEVIVYRRVRR